MSTCFVGSDEDGWEELAVTFDAYDLFRACDRAYTSGYAREAVDWLHENGYLEEGEEDEVVQVKCVSIAGALFEGGHVRAWVQWRPGTANYERVLREARPKQGRR